MLSKFQPTYDDEEPNFNEITNMSNVQINEISLNYSEETFDATSIIEIGKGIEFYAQKLS